MYTGKIIFSQIMDFLPMHEFRKCVSRYQGNYNVKTFSCLNKFLCMAFAKAYGKYYILVDYLLFLKLSRWLLNNELTPQSVSYINAQIDEYGEKERELQERLWEIEDKVSAIQKETANAEGVGDYLKDFVQSFEESDNGEQVLLVQSLVTEVVIKINKKVTVELRPPFGFITPSLALRGPLPVSICLSTTDN